MSGIKASRGSDSHCTSCSRVKHRHPLNTLPKPAEREEIFFRRRVVQIPCLRLHRYPVYPVNVTGYMRLCKRFSNYFFELPGSTIASGRLPPPVVLKATL